MGPCFRSPSSAVLGALLLLACASSERAGGGGGESAGGTATGAGGANGGMPSAIGGGGTVVTIDPGAGAAGSSGGEGAGCITADVQFQQHFPNVMLLVDRSASMFTNDFGDYTRWEAVERALTEPTSGIVTRLSSVVRFGLTFYTGPVTGGDEGDACPNLYEVPIKIDNLDAINALYQDHEPYGTTPTGESLELVWPPIADLDSQVFLGPRLIVLATDGEPNTCESAEASDQGRELSKQAVEHAFEAGIRVYVIGVGGQVAEPHLQELANLGLGFSADDPENRAYRAFNAGELSSALNVIINGVRDCVFDLNGEVEPGSEHLGTVELDGVAIPYDDPDGWHLSTPSQVVVEGAGCEAIQTGRAIDIDFPCEIFVPR